MGPLKFVVNGIVSCSLISSLKHFLFAMTEEQVWTHSTLGLKHKVVIVVLLLFVVLNS